MLRHRLSILISSLAVVASGYSLEADIGKDYHSETGDLSSFILGYAPKFGVRVLTTNGLPHITVQWRYKEASNELELLIEGNYFPQLNAFLSKAVGAPLTPPRTNNYSQLPNFEVYYGTNLGATVGCQWWRGDDGKDHTSFAIVSYDVPTLDQQTKLAQLIREAVADGNASSKALDAARSTAPYVSDFVRLFPKAEVHYRNFDASTGFDVTVDLHERYELTMQLPVRFDALSRSVSGYGEPHFYLWEVASVNRNKSGIAETRFNPAGERRFGSAEWNKIVESGGNFSAIGYTIISNQPVPGFKDRNIAK